ncbi:CD151 antigen-like [Pomacea canaliculata]|uniref:CD151 antigen-like n=1 Tax=Pomacea canaliculata TaxID=400727 RepID=UPI000D732B46|nr:CD151 antigen-like [Pomacea canaliculata]
MSAHQRHLAFPPGTYPPAPICCEVTYGGDKVMGSVAIGLGIYALKDKNNMAALTKIDSSGKIGEFNGVGLLQQGAIAIIYIIIVLLIVIAEVVAAALAIAFKDRIQEKFKEGLVLAIKEHYDGNLTSDNPFSRAFDYAQVQFDCCGANNYTDFLGSKWSESRGNDNVPRACCKLQNKKLYFDHNNATLADPSCPSKVPDTNNPNTGTPCYQAIRDWVTKHAHNIICAGFIILIIEIFAVVFGCCLYRAI